MKTVNGLYFTSLLLFCRVRKEDAYGRELAGRLSHQQRGELVQKLIARAGQQRPAHVARGKSRTFTHDFTFDK
jgi:hypothetical protein